MKKDIILDIDKCVGCGACEERCPFEVPIMEHMVQAARVFGQ